MAAIRSVIPVVGFGLFFASLSAILAPVARRLFLGRYGRRHRIIGAVYLWWLLLGFAGLASPRFPRLWFNVLLSLLGICLTLSAASDFQRHHSTVRNSASGALEPEATITVSEMVEHAFYHWLNLFQIAFLHAVSEPPAWLGPLDLRARLALVLLTTSPWLVRSRFPVNSFSDNYKEDPRTLVAVLYRMKKYQYMLYKHSLLHGLNLTVAFRGAPTAANELPLTAQHSFQLYWLALNTAYVMEFFLQTLVKRRYMQQRTMLALNQLLMVVSTLVAVQVLWQVDLTVSVASLLLNMAHRSRPFGEMVNFVLTMGLGAVVIER